MFVNLYIYLSIQISCNSGSVLRIKIEVQLYHTELNAR